MLNRMARMEAEIRQIAQNVNQILMTVTAHHQSEANGEAQLAEIPEGVELPLKSLNDLTSLEEKLLSADSRKKMVEFVAIFYVCTI